MSYAICEFVKGLMPGLKKDSVLEDLGIAIDTIDKILVPTVDKITTIVKNKFDSKEARSVEEVFNRAFKGKTGKKPNLLLTLQSALPNIRQNADYVKTRLEEILEATIVPDGITSRKAAMIRAAKQVSFIADFSLDLANYILILETVDKNTELNTEMELSKGTAIRVDRNIVRYAYAVTDLSRTPDEFKKLYESMKDIYVGGSNAKNVEMAGSEPQIDPFDSRLVQGVAYNPIYHFRIAIAGWQASRYHASKEKKKLLELRILQLKAEYDNKSDPRVLKEINYTQGRVDKLDREIHEIDDDLGIN